VQPGQRVLVNGASGGVGHLAVQLAKYLGATVIGAARPSKHKFVTGLGADVAIGHTSRDNVGDIEPVDVVIELVGGDICFALLDALVPGGILVSAQAAWAPGLRDAARAKNVRASWYLVEPDHHGLEALARLVDEGVLRVHVGSVAPLADAADVHRRLAAGDVRGKFVLRPTPDSAAMSSIPEAGPP
jgi:NADPH:quinone reductase-like Zn-dependent oxidoreductase